MPPVLTAPLPAAPSAIDRLTCRQREVLELIARGRSNAAIASELFISPRTLESHVRGIFTALDLPEDPTTHRRVLAALLWWAQSRG